MKTMLRLLNNTRNDSTVPNNPQTNSRTRSNLTLLLGLIVSLVSLVSAGFAQSSATGDNSSPKLVLRNTHLKGMNGQSLSPDGSTLTTQHRDGILKLWDAQSTNLVRVLKAPQTTSKQNAEFYGNHAFSPDGKHIACVWHEAAENSKDILLVWEVSSGTTRPVPLNGDFQTFQFTPNNQSLIAWNTKGRLVIWNVLSGEVKFDRQAHMQASYTIALSADEKTLATATEELDEVKIWDLNTQALKKTIKTGFAFRKTMLFSPDGNFVAISVSDCRTPAITKIYDTRTWKLFKLIDEYDQTIGFSADSQVFATTCLCEDLMLVNMKTGFELQTQKSPGFERTIKLLKSIPALKLFQSGEIVRAAFNEKTVEWNSATGKVTSVTDTKDLSRETEVISQQLFSTQPKELYFSGFTDSALQFGFSHNSGSSSTFSLDWQSLQLQPILEPPSKASEDSKVIMSIGLARDGKFSAIRFNGKIIGVLHEDDVEKKDGELVHTARTFLEEDSKDTLFGEETMISESDNLVVTTSHTGKATELIAELDKIREAKRKADMAQYEAAKAKQANGEKEGKNIELEDWRNDPWQKAAQGFFNQLETLSGTDELQTISVWDIKTGKRIQTMRGYRGWFQGGQFLNDGQVLVASHFEKAKNDEEFKLVLRFWDVQTGKLLHEIERSHEDSYHLKLVLSPNKETFVTTQQRDKQTEIELRHLKTGKIEQTFVVPGYTSISENSFSKDGKRLLVAGEDKWLLFDVASGKLQTAWEGSRPYYGAPNMFSPNGKMLVSYDIREKIGGGYNTIQLRDTETGSLLGQLVIFMDDPYVPPSPDGKPLVNAKPPVFDWILFTPQGHYTGSEGVEKYFTWQVGERALPGSAYAKEFNRPDLVQKALQIK